MNSHTNQSKRAIWVCFFITYLISWACWLPAVLWFPETQWLRTVGTFGPMIAAILLAAVQGGKKGITYLLKPLFHWRVNITWYLFSIFGTVVVAGLSLATYRLIWGPLVFTHTPQPWYAVFIAFPYVLFTSVLGEEIGWRGYALPGLQKRYSALGASLILGTVWACWHLPLFWMAGDFHQMLPFSLFLIQELALTVVMTWLYNNTKGSLLIAHLFHTASNVTFFVLPVLPFDVNGNLLPLGLAVGFLVLFSGVLIVYYGPEKLSCAVDDR